MAESPRRLPSPQAITPLWIIALFVSLTETVLTFALTKSSHGIQIALTAFVLTFPVLVAAAFFLILWHKPYVLYPPREYGRDTDVTSYVAAMQRHSIDDGRLYTTIESAVRASLTSRQLVSELSGTLSRGERVPTRQIHQILDAAADKTAARIRDAAFVSVDFSDITGTQTGVIELPYVQFTTISDLLDRLYLSFLARSVPARSYGTAWLLQDESTSEKFDDIGTLWAQKRGMATDSRDLETAGISPGAKLKVIPVSV